MNVIEKHLSFDVKIGGNINEQGTCCYMDLIVLSFFSMLSLLLMEFLQLEWNSKYYLYPVSQSQTSILTPSPVDVNMESPSPVYNYGKCFSESVTAEEMTTGTGFGGATLLNGPLAYVHNKSIEQEKNEMESQYPERIINEENSKRSAVSMGYPGQAVQIIATQKGNNIVRTEKVSMDTNDTASGTKITEEPVASVKIHITKDGIKVISDKETTV